MAAGRSQYTLAVTVPLAAVGVAANLAWPFAFRMGLGATGSAVGIVLVVVGLASYLASLIQVLVNVPQGRLITTGPFAVVRHPLYCAVALLVIPGIGILLDSWLGFAVGVVMYLATRHYRGVEETHLAATFGVAYRAYRAHGALGLAGRRLYSRRWSHSSRVPAAGHNPHHRRRPWSCHRVALLPGSTH